MVAIVTQQRASTTSALTVSAQVLDEAFFAHLAEGYWQWQALFERDPQARIDQHPDYVLNELRYAQRSGTRAGVVLFAQRGNDVVGAAILAPKQFGDGKRFGPGWKLSGYRLVGNQLLGAAESEVVAVLLDEVRQVLSRTRADFLMIEDIEDESMLRQAVLSGTGGMRVFQPAAFQAHHRIALESAVLDKSQSDGGAVCHESNGTNGTNEKKSGAESNERAPQRVAVKRATLAETYWQSNFTSKTRNTLRRKVKQFANGRLECVTAVEQVADYLAHAHEISKHSWQTELLGLRVRNDDRELEMLTTLATQGALRSYVLWQGDVPVSFCFGTQHNGVFMYEEVAYDRRHAESSPGQVLVIQMLDDLLAHDSPREFDFGFGDAEYKRQFGNRVSQSGPLWLLKPGLKSACIVGYINGRRRFVQGLRELLVKTGSLQWVKRKLKGGRT